MNKLLSFILTFLTVFILFWSEVNSNVSYNILPTTITNVANKAKLDLFLNKVLDSKSSFNSEVNYLIFLNTINDKLTSLGVKYSSNSDIKNMIEYLNIWLTNIINITKQNSDVESFLCEIFWDCWTWTSSSSTSSWWSTSSTSSSWWSTSSWGSTSCAWTAPIWDWIIKSTSVFWMVWSDTWTYVNNTKWTSTDLWQSCQWTCAPGYTKSVVSSASNRCYIKQSTVSCLWTLPIWDGVVKSTSMIWWVQDSEWLFINNWSWVNKDWDLWAACKWTCAPWYTRNWNTCSVSWISSWKMYASNTWPNDLSKLNGTIYLDKQLFIILDWVSKTTPPKGCAKLAW